MIIYISMKKNQTLSKYKVLKIKNYYNLIYIFLKMIVMFVIIIIF